MSTASNTTAPISVRLQHVTDELRQIQDVLASGEGVDASILTDFRDAVNRVRNTAWAVEQYANCKSTNENADTVLSLLAGERVRVAYQLCKLVETDLSNPDIRFQNGQLIELRNETGELARRLDVALGE